MSDTSFGQFLRQVREERGLTLEQAEEETKIRKFYLRALEEDNFSVMPAQVYAVGFLRKYCLFLGIDSEDMISRYKQLAGGTKREEDNPSAPVTATYHEKPPFISRVSTRNLAAALVFLVIVLWLGSYASDYLANRATEKQKPGVKPPVTVKNPPKTEEKPPVVQPQGVKLVLTGTGLCWYQVQVDSGAPEQGMIKSGETREYAAQDKISLKLGNAGGAKVAVNGKEPTYLGSSGEVVSQDYTSGQ